MLSIKKFAAIDIGSNAVRLLISTITEPDNKPVNFKKTSLVRVPIRLGQDVFTQSYISDESTERMVDTMKAFSLLMKSHKIEAYRACATSAMRDARNGQAVAEKIATDCNIDIDIIDGTDEAAIIAATDLHSLVDNNKTYLYVDVGGGSTEFTLFSNGKTIDSKSFKLGTVRILNNTISEDVWTEAEHWVKSVTKAFSRIEMVGSGGNINNIFKSSNKKTGKPLSFFYLSSYYQLLNSLTYEERISELSLNEDRADVIIPATKIYLSAMNWSRSRSVHVPKIGLVDGIIKSLYQNSKVGD
ncbi:Ppx/GppA phosphatase family protein [Psychroflexus sediminis]|uniref:Exopolyphosphatase / guanosine-5'-triphosphate,3'-diphosphate pyrophosphatase n=1 Tax=Psychroflexus sediminis TaxID=470826 RepID=A0A1G7V6A6_9FLAO|nr:exopolyphosphatase [Psychroflexus sediminis]SDG55304.1 exopolyphosphatase / guanosine-5'-triphosphate,3'-diphosphate pyrophosphatase [Psychroflexus sediminis]